MRIAICEDVPADARQISDALSRYLGAGGLTADIDLFAGGEEFLAAFAPGKYQIIFMDIYLKANGVTGMDAAAKVTAEDRDAALIFITTSEEHLLEGYNYAVYYVVKPVDDARLALAMGKCRIQIEKFAKTIEITADKYPVRIRLRDIYSVEAIGHSCVFKLAAQEITAAALVFDRLADQLGGFPFVRCHRSYIVNLPHVKDVAGNDFILEDGSLVPVGRNYKAAAQKAFRDYFWKRIQGEPL